MADNLRNYDFTLPADVRDLNELRETLNDKLQRIGEALESQNGLRGTVKLGADLDLNGFRVINAGQPQEPGDLITKDNAEKNYGYSTIKQLLEGFALDPTKFDGADDLYDEFIPEQVTNVTVKWKKKAGWKWFWEPPGGVARIVGYYIWLFNGSSFMHPEDGTIVATQAMAERFTERNVFSTDISLDELVAPFSTSGIKASIQAVVKIKGIGRVRGKIYTYPSLAGPGADPANGEDSDNVNWVSTNVPATLAQAGLVARWKKRGLRIKFGVPTFVINSSAPPRSHLKYGIVFANSTVDRYFDPDNPGNTSSVTDTPEYITDNNVMTLEIDKAELHSDFQAGLKFKVRVHNVKTGGVVGTSPYTNYSAFVTPTGDVLIEDTAAPTIAPTGGDPTAHIPVFRFKRGNLFCKLKLAAITNWNNPVKVEVCITDGSSKSLNLDDLDSDTPALVNTFYDIGKVGTKINIPMPKDQLRRIFAATGTIVLKFRLTNNIGSTTSADSVAMDLDTLRDVTTLYNPANLLRNGHFTYHDGINVKKWNRYDPRTGVIDNVDTTGRLEFDLTQHRVKWRNTNTVDNQRFLLQNLGKIFMRSEYYSLVWNFYSDGTPSIDEIVIALWTIRDATNPLTNPINTTNGLFTVGGSGFDTDLIKVGTIIGNGTEWRTVTQVNSSTLLTCDRAWGAGAGAGTSGFALIPQSSRLSQNNLALSTVDLLQKGVVLTDADLDTAKNIYFGVVLREVLGTSGIPFIDAICMNAGQESAGYQRSVDSFETNNAGTSENFDSQPTGGSSSGNQQPPGSDSGDPGEIVPIVY
jgi:hypothetical protein